MTQVGMGKLVKRATHHRAGKESTIDLIFTNIALKVSTIRHLQTGGDHDIIDITRRSTYIRKRL